MVVIAQQKESLRYHSGIILPLSGRVTFFEKSAPDLCTKKGLSQQGGDYGDCKKNVNSVNYNRFGIRYTYTIQGSFFLCHTHIL